MKDFQYFHVKTIFLDNICKMNCQTNKKSVTLKNGKCRNICIYRACRIKWITEIIKLANKNDKNIKIWKRIINFM